MLLILDDFKRKLMSFLTCRIGRSQISTERLKIDEIHKILIIRPNHRLGNQLLISPLIQEIENTFQACSIDLFLKGPLGEIIYKNYSSVNECLCLPKKHFKALHSYLYCWTKLIFRKYDLVINAVPESSSGKIASMIARSPHKVYTIAEENVSPELKDYKHIAKKPIYHLRLLSGIQLSEKIPELNLKLTPKEILKGKEIIEQIFNNNKKTIALFTYATRDKCYPKEWWADFYGSLINKYGTEYNFLEILPKENISQIDFRTQTLYSHDLREIAAVIQNVEILIAADSGMMHLGCAANTPVIGLFSVTDPSIYGPYGRFNLAVNTNSEDICKIINQISSILN